MFSQTHRAFFAGSFLALVTAFTGLAHADEPAQIAYTEGGGTQCRDACGAKAAEQARACLEKYAFPVAPSVDNPTGKPAGEGILKISRARDFAILACDSLRDSFWDSYYYNSCVLNAKATFDRALEDARDTCRVEANYDFYACTDGCPEDQRPSKFYDPRVNWSEIVR